MKRTLLLALLLGGCTVGPGYKPPETPMPPRYDAPSQVSGALSQPLAESVDLSAWWRGFRDGELESLITRALAQNPDLLTAASRVREAREQEIIAGAAGLPQANALADAAHIHSGSNILQKLGGNGAGSSPGGGSGSTDIKLYAAGFDATWELDIFGQVRRSVEAAAAGTEAARWQMRDGEVSLTAEIAADYVTLRQDQARLAILDSHEKSQQEILDLVAARARAGFVTELDVNQQRQLLAATRAERPPLRAEIMAMRHAIAVLLGQEPGTLDGELETSAPLPPLPPQLPVGLPSDLLRARPDIRMAERKMAQANANIGVAVAELYPKFNLLGALTFSSNHVSNLFSGDNLNEVGLGFMTWPAFYGGQIHANIRAKEEEQRQAYYAYQKSVLAAVQNAEDALARYLTEQQRFAALKEAQSRAAQSTALALQQYRVGLTPYINVLQTQSTQLDAEDKLAQSQATLSANLVSVYKALGGGWKEEAEAAPSKEGTPLFRQ